MKRRRILIKFLGAFGALLALAATFLPFTAYTSFFSALGPVCGPAAVWLLALAAVLCIGRGPPWDVDGR